LAILEAEERNALVATAWRDLESARRDLESKFPGVSSENLALRKAYAVLDTRSLPHQTNC
jgi:hypothetical protein